MNSGSQLIIASGDADMGDGAGNRAPEIDAETGFEIVEDLVQMMTFQKLSCSARSESGAPGANLSVVPSDVPRVRVRRARTVTAQSRPIPHEVRPGHETIIPRSRPRKHSHDASSLDNRRKRSFSMCESDEDDELASLSSSASYQSTKHQKLKDEYDDPDELPQYLPSDSIFGNGSLSSASMDSSTSSMGSIPYPTAMRVAVPRVTFPSTSDVSARNSWSASSSAVTPSSSSPRSSPCSGASSPPKIGQRGLPSVFKRAQSDGEVLMRVGHREGTPSSTTPTQSHVLPCLTSQDTLSRFMEVSPVSVAPVPQTAEYPNPGQTLSGSGRRSVSASSLPTTFRSMPSNSPQSSITFSASPTPLHPGVIKPIALSPPTRKSRRGSETQSPGLIIVSPQPHQPPQ